MGFHIGDIVKVIDESVEGIIIAIHRDEIVVEIDGFEFTYSPTEVLKVMDNNQIIHKSHEKSFDAILIEKAEAKKSRNKFLGKLPSVFAINKKGLPEIDLHIHELIDRPQDYSNSEKLHIQLTYLDHFLRLCTEKSQSECVVIHGVGEGVLKSEVRQRLINHGHIDFWDADFTEYGFGATHVKIHGLFR